MSINASNSTEKPIMPAIKGGFRHDRQIFRWSNVGDPRFWASSTAGSCVNPQDSTKTRISE